MRRIVCLANSRKYSGRCIAGKEFPAPGNWLRPVSKRSTGELTDRERRYGDGTFPHLLDVIDIPLHRPVPHLFQTENVQIDPTHSWTKAGELPLAYLNNFLDPPAILWFPGNRVPLEQASTFSDSLRLIQVNVVTITVRTENIARWQVRSEFQYSGELYNLSVTDCEVEQRAFAKPEAVTTVWNVFLTVSLGEPFQDNCYKLVAAILPTPAI